MTRQEMPIFTRSFDFLTWLLLETKNFPRAYRHSFTQRLLDAAFDLRERLEGANFRKGAARLERLDRAGKPWPRSGSTFAWPLGDEVAELSSNAR